MSRARLALLTATLALTLGSAACKKKTAEPGGTNEAAGSGSATPAAPATEPAATAPTTPPPATGAAGTAPIAKASTPAEAVAAADRTAEDKALDAGRKPAELLSFLKLAPGMKVAEIFAGGGYTVELLARVVGPTGMVYAHNTPKILEMFARKPWSERLARIGAPWIVSVERELDSPFPEEAKDLDLVVMNLVYHDAVAMGIDRTGMNAAIWKALKPGGEFVVVDHSAKDGTGPNEASTLHRIEAKYVQDEVLQSGFALDRQSDLYKNAEDKRDWNASPSNAKEKRGTSDRFVLVFKKPLDGVPANSK